MTIDINNDIKYKIHILQYCCKEVNYYVSYFVIVVFYDRIVLFYRRITAFLKHLTSNTISTSMETRKRV